MNLCPHLNCVGHRDSLACFPCELPRIAGRSSTNFFPPAKSIAVFQFTFYCTRLCTHCFNITPRHIMKCLSSLIRPPMHTVCLFCSLLPFSKTSTLACVSRGCFAITCLVASTRVRLRASVFSSSSQVYGFTAFSSVDGACSL